jgi:hypothetical protein
VLSIAVAISLETFKEIQSLPVIDIEGFTPSLSTSALEFAIQANEPSYQVVRSIYSSDERQEFQTMGLLSPRIRC